MWETISQIAPYAVGYTVPILITALGGLYSERSGIVNIGLEGIMVMGSFAGAMFGYFLGPIIGGTKAAWIGIIFAMLLGGLFSLIHAFASINLNANQTISGTAINMMAGAITIFLARKYVGTGSFVVNSMTRIDIPLLNKIPILGPLFFTDTYPTTWFVLLIVVISWYVIKRTTFGLRLRACGDNPDAAESAGINVGKMRYTGVILSGIFAGVGGGIYTLTTAGQFSGSVAGVGFLALAGLIFGQWKVMGVLLATLFFGFAVTLGQISQLLPSMAMIPPLVLKIFPYVVTLIALAVSSKSSQAPRASGKYFEYKK